MLTDVLGYSGMVEQDEVATPAELKALREAVIDPLLACYHGRLVKLMGDGAMVGRGGIRGSAGAAAGSGRLVALARGQTGGG